MRINSLLSGYLAGVSSLASFLTLPDSVLYRRPATDSWSAAEIIHHLADVELITSERIRRILTEDEPMLRAWDQASYARVLNYSRRPVLHAVGTVSALRHSNGELLAELSDEQWIRTGIHAEAGRVDLRAVVNEAITHLDDHLTDARSAIHGVATRP